MSALKVSTAYYPDFIFLIMFHIEQGEFQHRSAWVQSCLSFFQWGTHSYLSEIRTQTLSVLWTELNGSPLCTPVSCRRREENPTWATILRRSQTHVVRYVWNTTLTWDHSCFEKEKSKTPQGPGKMGGRFSRAPGSSSVFDRTKHLAS